MAQQQTNKLPEFRYRPARLTYAPVGNNLVVEMVRDGEILDQNRREIKSIGLILPETFKKEGWMMSDPVVRIVAVGPDVKDQRLKPGVVLVVPKGVARSAPELIYRAANTWPDGDVVYLINETNVGTIVPEAEAAAILQAALEAAEA